MIKIVYPSAGHNDRDPGAVSNGYKEADLTKELRNLVSAELTRRNHKHIMDKDWESNRQHQNRIKPGSGSVLLDIHFNAASPQATGTEILVAVNANANSRAFAKEIVDATARILGITNRGVKSEAVTRHKRLGVLHLGAGIAALVEVCFITNPSDIMKYQAKKGELANAYADILIKYDNLIR